MVPRNCQTRKKEKKVTSDTKKAELAIVILLSHLTSWVKLRFIGQPALDRILRR
jgi:hypothetical protein